MGIVGLKALFDGHVEGRRGDWRNRMAGPRGVPLTEAHGSDVVHVGYRRCGAILMQKNRTAPDSSDVGLRELFDLVGAGRGSSLAEAT